MQANQSPTQNQSPANPILTRLAKRALKAYRLTSNPHRTWKDEVRARNRLDHIFREMEKQDPPISYSELQREIARLENIPSSAAHSATHSATQSYPSATHHAQR